MANSINLYSVPGGNIVFVKEASVSSAGFLGFQAQTDAGALPSPVERISTIYTNHADYMDHFFRHRQNLSEAKQLLTLEHCFCRLSEDRRELHLCRLDPGLEIPLSSSSVQENVYFMNGIWTRIMQEPGHPEQFQKIIVSDPSHSFFCQPRTLKGALVRIEDILDTNNRVRDEAMRRWPADPHNPHKISSGRDNFFTSGRVVYELTQNRENHTYALICTLPNIGGSLPNDDVKDALRDIGIYSGSRVSDGAVADNIIQILSSMNIAESVDVQTKHATFPTGDHPIELRHIKIKTPFWPRLGNAIANVFRTNLPINSTSVANGALGLDRASSQRALINARRKNAEINILVSKDGEHWYFEIN